MGIGKYFVTEHAVARLRERLHAQALSDYELLKRVEEAVEASSADDSQVKTPGGVLVPISILGEDGYLVLNGDRVVTVLDAKQTQNAKSVK